jgi:hypothetical protein
MGFTGGFGVTFNIGSAAMSGTPTYTAIAQVKTWNGYEISTVMSEVTHHASTGGFKEFVPSGLSEMGTIELGLAFDISLATHANASGGLIYARTNKTKLAYQIVLPNTGTTKFTFDAYVEKINWESPQEEHLMATVTLRPTGQPTIT